MYTTPSHAKTIQPTTHVGTWQNKDEDGDGVPDEQDDYPFDASKTQYPVFIEQEPNDNPTVATPVELGKGFKVQGVISSRTDKGDLYGFDVDDVTFITAVFKTDAPRFDPQVYLSDSDGLVQNSIVLFEDESTKTQIVNFQIRESGRYQLSVLDNNYAGGPDLSYEISVFYDEDVDAFDDQKERALGSLTETNDMDQDGIKDGFEFVLLNTPADVDVDFDEDGIPNWQDTDSDGDSFSDKIEGIEDLNNDGLPNYIDRDADGNTIDDKLESGDFNNPNDFDNDGKIDHLDLDDDGDLILDIFDKQRLKKAQTVKRTGPDSLLVRWVYNVNFEGQSIRDFIRVGDEVEFEVDGLPADANNLVLIFEYAGDLINLEPTIARIEENKTYLSVELPNKVGEANVYLAHDEVITDALPIEINQRKAPLLKEDKRNISVDETITLVGENFDEQTVVHFNNMTVNSIFIDEKTIKVKTPRKLSGWRYWVSNQFGKSNTVSFSIR